MARVVFSWFKRLHYSSSWSIIYLYPLSHYIHITDGYLSKILMCKYFVKVPLVTILLHYWYRGLKVKTSWYLILSILPIPMQVFTFSYVDCIILYFNLELRSWPFFPQICNNAGHNQEEHIWEWACLLMLFTDVFMCFVCLLDLRTSQILQHPQWAALHHPHPIHRASLCLRFLAQPALHQQRPVLRLLWFYSRLLRR